LKILVVGSGGREHALLWKLHQDAPDAQFFIAGGNGGTVDHAETVPLDVHDRAAFATWCVTNNIDLVVIGPEGPLADGLADALTARAVPVFGPSQAAADIEASKAFAKSLMQRAGIPTAAFETFHTLAPAEQWIRERGAPIVVKASGLAAGKGAVVCMSVEEAIDTARTMLDSSLFGAAGSEIVIEEFMAGEELSLFALCDGVHAIPMIGVQDHKRIGEGDTGPNTGGMGAYAPVSTSTPALIERVRSEILDPTLAAMRAEGRAFSGLLYAGLMLTDAGPKVVEFNCRFGDPETQVVLPLLKSSLLEPMLAIARGESIAGLKLEWRDAYALTTVVAAAGYPGSVQRGDPIAIGESTVASADGSTTADVMIFHAGTKIVDGTLVTNGGRVFAVTAVAPDLPTAARMSRDVAEKIMFNGRQLRRDIGWRELQRLKNSKKSAQEPDAGAT
jgi:phosphoribosylamine--glycine ligase